MDDMEMLIDNIKKLMDTVKSNQELISLLIKRITILEKG
jgi:hypothetical protein